MTKSIPHGARSRPIRRDTSSVVMSSTVENENIDPPASTSTSASASVSQYPIETKKIQLSQVLAEVKICKPTAPSNGMGMGTGMGIGIGSFASFANIFAQNNNKKKKQPLLFIHGSFHASWCWAEHYMSFFASLGYPSYALSLRGTGGTFAGEGVTKVKIDEHVGDLTDIISYIRECEGADTDTDTGANVKPVLVAHSFGGLAVMKYLEQNLMSDGGDDSSSSEDLLVSGVVSLCSVPPSGNGKMTMRFLKRSLVDSWKITAGLAMRKCITNKELCRELFFDENDDTISDEEVGRIQGYFKRDTDAIIDLVDLAKQLPSVNVDDSGKALFLPSTRKLPSLVVGATDDFIVDKEGVLELARYYDVEPVFVNSAHDIMLGKKWTNGADVIKSFLEQVIL